MFIRVNYLSWRICLLWKLVHDILNMMYCDVIHSILVLVVNNYLLIVTVMKMLLRNLSRPGRIVGVVAFHVFFSMWWGCNIVMYLSLCKTTLLLEFLMFQSRRLYCRTLRLRTVARRSMSFLALFHFPSTFLFLVIIVSSSTYVCYLLLFIKAINLFIQYIFLSFLHFLCFLVSTRSNFVTEVWWNSELLNRCEHITRHHPLHYTLQIVEVERNNRKIHYYCRDKFGGFTRERNSYWIKVYEVEKILKQPTVKKVGYSRFTSLFEDLHLP